MFQCPNCYAKSISLMAKITAKSRQSYPCKMCNKKWQVSTYIHFAGVMLPPLFLILSTGFGWLSLDIATLIAVTFWVCVVLLQPLRKSY